MIEEKTTDGFDARTATEIITNYLERIYGNLNMSLFRIEEVRPNGDDTKYFVLCSLITSLGSSKRTYYFFKIDIKEKRLLIIHQGFMDEKTKKIIWEKINLPEKEEEEEEKIDSSKKE